jgi:hypothetical protein
MKTTGEGYREPVTETPAVEIGHEIGAEGSEIGSSNDFASETISDALAVIDRSLAQLFNRELVSTDEVADLLLDVRSLLTKDSVPAAN